jgi:hypothetical protein
MTIDFMGKNKACFARPVSHWAQEMNSRRITYRLHVQNCRRNGPLAWIALLNRWAVFGLVHLTHRALGVSVPCRCKSEYVRLLPRHLGVTHSLSKPVGPFSHSRESLFSSNAPRPIMCLLQPLEIDDHQDLVTMGTARGGDDGQDLGLVTPFSLPVH